MVGGTMSWQRHKKLRNEVLSLKREGFTITEIREKLGISLGEVMGFLQNEFKNKGDNYGKI